MNERSVYISYRPAFSSSIALALFQALRAEAVDAFIDLGVHTRVDALHLAQIEACSHFLIVISPGLIESLQKPDDPLRAEIDHAVQTRRAIVPLLANGFSFGNTFVPDEIGFLRRYYALPLTPETLASSIMTLKQRLLKKQIFGTITPPPAADQATVARMIAEAEQQLPAPTVDELLAETIFNDIHSRSGQDISRKMADFDEVLRLNPAYVTARFDRARARCRSGDEAGAITDYDEVLRQRPRHYKAYNNRAELHFALGSYTQALADFEQALLLSPGFIMALDGAALTLHALGRVDEALRMWESLLEQDERFGDALWVGTELRLPAAMVAEAHRLTQRLKTQTYASDD